MMDYSFYLTVRWPTESNPAGLPTRIDSLKRETRNAKTRIKRIIDSQTLQDLTWMRLLRESTFLFDVIVSGYQQPGCDGTINPYKAQDVCFTLNQLAPRNIIFNHKKIVSSLKGGICTAMAMRFIQVYFRARESCLNKRDYAWEMTSSLIYLRTLYSQSSPDLRDLQAAFDTIEIQKSSKDDLLRNKVQAILNFYSYEILEASDEIKLNRNFDQIDFFQLIYSFEEGVYFVRNIGLENNKKQESQGHSTVYIREKGLNIYYDPNVGILNLGEFEKHPKCLYVHLKEDSQKFKLDLVRFYRVAPKKP